MVGYHHTLADKVRQDVDLEIKRQNFPYLGPILSRIVGKIKKIPHFQQNIG